MWYKTRHLIVGISCLFFTFPALAQDTLECEAGFRLVEHALGESCIPEQPQRVFTLDMTTFDLLLVAGIEPPAFSGVILDTLLRMHPEMEATFESFYDPTVDVGFPPNVETVIATQPDLIIIPNDFFGALLYPQLSEAIPTIVYEPTPGDWKTRLRESGELLGLSDLVEELIADYDARVAELQVTLGEDASEIDISLVRTFPDQIGLVVAGMTASTTLQEVGLGRPEAQAVDYEYVLSELDGRSEILISEESLTLAEGDFIFLFGDPGDLLSNPLWNALSAIQAGNMAQVGYYWWGDGLFAAHDQLDDIFEYIAQVEPTLPNPFENGITPTVEATAEATPAS